MTDATPARNPHGPPTHVTAKNVTAVRDNSGGDAVRSFLGDNYPGSLYHRFERRGEPG